MTATLSDWENPRGSFKRPWNLIRLNGDIFSLGVVKLMPPSSGSQTQFANSQRGKKILKLFPQNFAEDQQPDLSSNMNWRNNSPKSFWISGSHLLWSWWQVEWLAQKRPGWSFCSTWWPDRTKPTASNHFFKLFPHNTNMISGHSASSRLGGPASTAE